MDAKRFIDELTFYQWHNINTVPEVLSEEIMHLLELNQFTAYRIGWNEMHSYLFMKTKKSEKQGLIQKLAEVERGIGIIDWVFVRTREGEYIISLWQSGNIKPTDNATLHNVFQPNKPIQEYFQWIYNHGVNIKIKYLNTQAIS